MLEPAGSAYGILTRLSCTVMHARLTVDFSDFYWFYSRVYSCVVVSALRSTAWIGYLRYFSRRARTSWAVKGSSGTEGPNATRPAALSTRAGS